METVVVLSIAGIAVAVSGVVAAVVMRRRRRAEPEVRDDTVRVGRSADRDPRDAAREAADKHSWMIPGGF
ncbi:hypothetical protein [Agromyces seonyuensis]|uniref:Uncharacterized protein n=1 Tax=Agromyces seonyuensis TaxID=2662446 RepID=A0A6I4NW63_9MICO|nr:hypothetical protein [Agromyces seonyuensis]MWB98513.1 hypothetical protein [Agromyces seonyuensis]